MKVAELLGIIDDCKIVSTPRGSWRWQDAFRVSYYQAVGTETGRVIYRHVDHSAKMSEPQMRNSSVVQAATGYGSLHNKPVMRADAIKAIGVSRVRMVEGHGYHFEA